MTEVALRVMHAISKIHWVCTYTIFDFELFPQIAHTRTHAHVQRYDDLVTSFVKVLDIWNFLQAVFTTVCKYYTYSRKQ